MVRLVILLTIIATICITVVKPGMHKQFLVYNSDYRIVTTDDDSDNNYNQQEIPTVDREEITSKPKIDQVEQKSQIVFNPLVVEKQKQQIKQASQSKVEKIVYKENPKVTTQQITVPKNAKNIVEKYSKTSPIVQEQVKTTVKEPVKTGVVQTVKNDEKKSVQKQVTPVKTVEKEQTPVQKSQVVHLPAVQPTKTAAQIAQEEEIAWNKWRSRLQNQIMADVRMPNIPYGVIFKFSFTVDKYGKISNVQTWSTTPSYTPHAIQYIAPVIRSYQGHSILNFPHGSNRVTTEVVGAWKISNNSRYSTPQDYNDTERVTR